MAEPIKQVTFVCTGNICRSPMAEYVFRHRVGPALSWTAASAGLFALYGSPASEHAVQALAEWEIDLSPHRSQPLTAELVDKSDLVLVMTNQHRQEIALQFPHAAEKTELLTSFSTAGDIAEVADPIGQSLYVYRTVRDQIDSALADVILHLRGQSQAG